MQTVMLAIMIFFTPCVYGNLKNLKVIKAELSSTDHAIKVQKNELLRVENDLGSKNKTYLTTINIKRKIREEIYKIDGRILELEKNVNIKEEQLSSIMMQFLASNMGDHDDIYAEVEKALILDGLKEEVEKFQDMKNIFSNLKEESSELTKNLREYEIAESDVFQLIKELEKEKSLRFEKLTLSSEKRSILKKKLSKIGSKKKKASGSRMGKRMDTSEFIPLAKLINWEKHKNGVNLVGHHGADLVSPRSGKVIYVGQLSAFGNVMILEHDNNVKSILLGELEAEVSKGQKIKLGQTIGKLRSSKKLPAKIYFEYRLENQTFLTDNLVAKLKNNKNQRIKL